MRGVDSRGGRDTIDFADASAVRTLNTALLKSDYGVAHWELLEGKLCPPVPGRADYLHHMADVLRASAGGRLPGGRNIVGFDIGTGASVIYPLIGAAAYGWKFVGSECDPHSFAAAQRIVRANSALDIEVRLQPSTTDILKNVLGEDEEVDFVMCNPPFFDSPQAFAAANARKVGNLRQNSQKRGSTLAKRGSFPRGRERPQQGQVRGSNNFAGDASELVSSACCPCPAPHSSC